MMLLVLMLVGCSNSDVKMQEVESLKQEVETLKQKVEDLSSQFEESKKKDPMSLDEAYEVLENYFESFKPSNEQVNEVRLKKYNKHEDGEGIESITVYLVNTDDNRPYFHESKTELNFIDEQEFVKLYEEMTTYCNDVLEGILPLIESFEGKITVLYMMDNSYYLTSIRYYGEDNYRTVASYLYSDIFQRRFGYQPEEPTFKPWSE
ncbi:MAG: hypothetical protein [Malazfec virus 1]